MHLIHRHVINILMFDKWIVLICAFCNYILVNGAIYSFGVLYVELLDSFEEDKERTAWIGSIQLGMVNLGGVFAGSVIRRFGIKRTIFIGSLLSCAGYLASSFATTIYVMYITYGAIPGLGLDMISLSSLIAVEHHFDEQQAFAMGICQSGGSVGGFVFNPLLQTFIETYGWRGSMLVLAGILSHAIFFGLLMHILERTKPETDATHIQTDAGINKHSGRRSGEDKAFILMQCRRKLDSFNEKKENAKSRSASMDEEQFSTQKEYYNGANMKLDEEKELKRHTLVKYTHDELLHDDETQVDKRKFGEFLSIVNKVIPCTILRHRPTCIVLISSHIRSFGFFVPFMLLPDLAVTRDIEVEKAAWLASSMGISGAVSRVAMGWIGSFPSVNRLYLYIFCLLVGGVLTVLCPLFTVYDLLMVYACIFGFLMGGEVSLTPIICSDVAGKDKLPETYGMLRTLCGVGALCGTPLSGWLFEETSSYHASFILSGFLITISGFILLLLKCGRIVNSHEH